MVTDIGSASTFRRNFNSLSFQTKSTKNEGTSENMDFKGKPVWSFQTEKKNRNNILDLSEKNPIENEEPYGYQLISALVSSKN